MSERQFCSNPQETARPRRHQVLSASSESSSSASSSLTTSSSNIVNHPSSTIDNYSDYNQQENEFAAASTSMLHFRKQEQSTELLLSVNADNSGSNHDQRKFVMPASLISPSSVVSTPVTDLVTQFVCQASLSNQTPRRRLSLDTTGGGDSDIILLGTHGTTPSPFCVGRKHFSSAEDINLQLNCSLVSLNDSGNNVEGMSDRGIIRPFSVGAVETASVNFQMSSNSSPAASSPPTDFSSLHLERPSRLSEGDKLAKSEPKIVYPGSPEEYPEKFGVGEDVEAAVEHEQIDEFSDYDDEFVDGDEGVDEAGIVDYESDAPDAEQEKEKEESKTTKSDCDSLFSATNSDVIIDDNQVMPIPSNNYNNDNPHQSVMRLLPAVDDRTFSQRSSEDDSGTILAISNQINVLPTPMSPSISSSAGSVFMSAESEESRDSGYSETSNPPIFNLATEGQRGFEAENGVCGPIDFAQPIGVPLRSSQQSKQKSQSLPPASSIMFDRHVRFPFSSSVADHRDDNSLDAGIADEEDDDEGWRDDVDENDDIDQEFMGSLTLGDLAGDASVEDGQSVIMSYSPNCLNVIGGDNSDEAVENSMFVRNQEGHRRNDKSSNDDQLNRTPNSRNASLSSGGGIRRHRPLRKSGLALLTCGAPNIADLQPRAIQSTSSSSFISSSSVSSSAHVLLTSSSSSSSIASSPNCRPKSSSSPSCSSHGPPLVVVRTPMSTLQHSNSSSFSTKTTTSSSSQDSSSTQTTNCPNYLSNSNNLSIGSKRCRKGSPNEGEIVHDNKENKVINCGEWEERKEVSKTTGVLQLVTAAPIRKRRKSLASPSVLALMSSTGLADKQRGGTVDTESDLLIRKKAQNRFLNVRCQSESVLRLSQGGLNFDDRNLVADYSKGHLLPLINNPVNSGMSSISCHTVAKLLQNKLAIPRGIRFQFIDCRYPYEYQGGHVNGAVHFFVNRPETLNSQWFSPPPPAGSQQETIYIFYCEFSRERGPKMYRAVRAMDRKINSENYPKCSYPEIYLLEGGYKNFYANYPELCFGGYKPMVDDMAACRQFKAKSKSCSTLPGDTVARRPGLQRSLLNNFCSLRSSSTLISSQQNGLHISAATAKSLPIQEFPNALSLSNNANKSTDEPSAPRASHQQSFSYISQPIASSSITCSSGMIVSGNFAEFTMGNGEFYSPHPTTLQQSIITLIPDNHLGSPSL